MKTKMFKLINKLCILLCVFFITSNLYSQTNWGKEEISTKSNNYFVRKSGDIIYVSNLKFKGHEKGDRTQYDMSNKEFSSVKLRSHDDFLKIFNDVFISERIKELSTKDERILLFLNINEKAQVISIRFSLSKESVITIEEIESLENQVLNTLKFDIVGKKLTEPIYYTWSIRVYFKEVEKGEIEFARKSENYTGR